MLGILFGLIAAVGQALGYVFIKRSTKELPVSIAYAFDAILGLLLWIPFSLIVGVDFAQLPTVLVYALISALLAEAYVLYVHTKGEIGLTSVVFSTYPMFTVLLAVLLLGESLTVGLWLAVFMTIAGIVITSVPNKLVDGTKISKKFLLWPLSAALAVGVSDVLSKSVIDQTDAATFLFALALMQIPASLIFLKFQKTKLRQVLRVVHEWEKYKDAFIGAFFIVSTLIAFWLTFQYELASIASPLTGSYAVFVLLLAHFWLKERLSVKDKIGVIITLAGVFILSILRA